MKYRQLWVEGDDIDVEGWWCNNIEGDEKRFIVLYFFQPFFNFECEGVYTRMHALMNYMECACLR